MVVCDRDSDKGGLYRWWFTSYVDDTKADGTAVGTTYLVHLLVQTLAQRTRGHWDLREGREAEHWVGSATLQILDRVTFTVPPHDSKTQYRSQILLATAEPNHIGTTESTPKILLDNRRVASCHGSMSKEFFLQQLIGAGTSQRTIHLFQRYVTVGKVDRSGRLTKLWPAEGATGSGGAATVASKLLVLLVARER